MNPDKIRIVDSNATSRKCDHPGVVGENESCKRKTTTTTQTIKNYYQFIEFTVIAYERGKKASEYRL